MTDVPRTPLLNPGFPPPGNSFVLLDHKLVYVSITKAANTSLRWMFADLAGENFDRFYQAPGNHSSRIMTIHANRGVWQHATSIADVPDGRREEISRDNGWFIYVVIRDPWSRLWSAWSSKMLVRHGNYTRRYLDKDWFPRLPQRPGDVLEDWFRFVEARPWESDDELSIDPHFMTQAVKVRPERVNYTRIYDLTEMPILLDDLRAHLRGIGKAKNLYLPRANETPIPMMRGALDNGVAEVIEESFQLDFVTFGNRWKVSDVKLSDPDISADALRAVAIQSESNERIDDMSMRLQRTLATSESRRKKLLDAQQAADAEKSTVRASPAPAATRSRRRELGRHLLRRLPTRLRRVVRDRAHRIGSV